MKRWKKLLPPALALLLALNLTACGGDAQPNSDAPGDTAEPVTDMAFLDGMWSIDGLTKLYFDGGEGCYVYRSYYGLGGRGEFSEVDGRPMKTSSRPMEDMMTAPMAAPITLPKPPESEMPPSTQAAMAVIS